MLSTTPDSPRVRRAVVLRLLGGALGLRLVTAVLALLVNVAFPLYQREQFTVFGETSPFWDTFARYDSGFYEGIAWGGYTPVVGGRSNIAYFPVYPMLIRVFGRLFERHHATHYLVGIGVAWAAFFGAMVALYFLARLDLPRVRAERAVLLAAVFPFAFFYGVVYSESTFLLFTLLAMYGFRTRRWVLAGLCGAVATATRVPGIMMMPALAWAAWRGAEPTWKDRGRAAAALAVAACGFGAYCAYIYSLTGNPFEWAATLQRWGYYPGGQPWLAPMTLLKSLVTHPYAFIAGERMAPYDSLNGVTAVIFVLLIPFVWARLGAAYGLFMAAFLWLPLSSGQYEGLGRYCAVLFPAFVWLASLRSKAAVTAVLVVSGLFYTLCLALFTTIHPLF